MVAADQEIHGRQSAHTEREAVGTKIPSALHTHHPLCGLAFPQPPTYPNLIHPHAGYFKKISSSPIWIGSVDR